MCAELTESDGRSSAAIPLTLAKMSVIHDLYSWAIVTLSVPLLSASSPQ